MTTILYLLTLVLPMATILIVFAMRYYEARARLANDNTYRQLAESASAAQSRIATSLAAMEANVSEMRTRMAAVETILKAVE